MQHPTAHTDSVDRSARDGDNVTGPCSLTHSWLSVLSQWPVWGSEPNCCADVPVYLVEAGKAIDCHSRLQSAEPGSSSEDIRSLLSPNSPPHLRYGPIPTPWGGWLILALPQGCWILRWPQGHCQWETWQLYTVMLLWF